MEATAEEIRSTWGEALATARREAGLTQRAFAAQLDWDPQRITRMERGFGSIETFATAAHALGVELVLSEGA